MAALADYRRFLGPIESITKDKLEELFRPSNDELVETTQRVFALSALLGMDHVLTDLSLADGPDEFAKELPYEEAVRLLKGRVPMKKKDWLDLEAKLRFRAFTVAKLTTYKEIDKVRQGLIKALEDGTGLATFWNDLEEKNAGEPEYWENVYRTNLQTIYNAGRRIQIDKTDPEALQLIVIEDDRTSTICRPLVGLTLPAGSPFWKTHWPPFHFRCRTTIRAIYGQGGRYSPLTTAQVDFRPQEGFGLDPIDNGNYWMMLPSMFEQGLKTGAITEFNFMDNVIADYDKQWNGYSREHGKHGGWVDVPINKPSDFLQNLPIARSQAELGKRVKILPSFGSVDRWKNPDVLVDGRLVEYKEVASSKARGLQDRLSSAADQKVRSVVLVIPDAMTVAEVKRGLLGWFSFNEARTKKIDHIGVFMQDRYFDLTPTKILGRDFGF